MENSISTAHHSCINLCTLEISHDIVAYHVFMNRLQSCYCGTRILYLNLGCFHQSLNSDLFLGNSVLEPAVGQHHTAGPGSEKIPIIWPGSTQKLKNGSWLGLSASHWEAEPTTPSPSTAQHSSERWSSRKESGDWQVICFLSYGDNTHSLMEEQQCYPSMPFWFGPQTSPILLLSIT